MRRPDLRPVKIAAGAVGNRRELCLSPQHAVFVPGSDGGQLIRARHLAEHGGGARVARGVRQVSYHHLLLPRHALVWAEQGLAESFYPGRMAVAALPGGARIALCGAILARYPALAESTLEARYGPRCRGLLTRRQALEWLAATGWGKAGRNQLRMAKPDAAVIAGRGDAPSGKKPASLHLN